MGLQGDVVDTAEHGSEVGGWDAGCVGLFGWVENCSRMRKRLLTGSRVRWDSHDFACRGEHLSLSYTEFLLTCYLGTLSRQGNG
jgi:hypothetical protein